MRRGHRYGIDLFLEDGAYTTLAAAVSILVIVALLFSGAQVVWNQARAGDTQVAADATALAGSNVVASYRTTATVVDACILSMGLTGMCLTGVGLVGVLIPGARIPAGTTLRTGLNMLKTRNRFATSASKGLKKLEATLPYLVAANGTRTCAAQDVGEVSFTGTALAVPRESESEFPAIAGDQVPTEGLEEASAALDEAAERLEEASQASSDAKRKAWLADCGSDGRNMQERAGHLSQVSALENPDYASSITWEPEAGIKRARAYYRARIASEKPKNESVDEQANSAARRVFYTFALREMEAASITDTGDEIIMNVPLLPRNTEEVRRTTLYTDICWPSTTENGTLTLHYDSSCPGATGAAGPALSLAAIDEGRAQECPVCKFSVGDVGRTPAASTSIDNGFEHHLRAYTLALEEYVDCRNREYELSREAQDEAEGASESFEEALSTIAGKRPRIAPPGRLGCVAIVGTGEFSAPEGLEVVAPIADVSPRGAIAASVLAPDEATAENNVLSKFFSSLEERGGGGAVGLVDDVMGLWGSLLVAYGGAGDALGSLFDQLLGGLTSFGAGPIASWLSDSVEGVISGLGFEPVDMRVAKPVLTDSSAVIAQADIPALADVQETLRSLAISSTDPKAIAEAVGYEVGERVLSTSVTLAEIPLPSGGTIPLEVRIGDVIEGVAAGAGS